MNKYNKNTVVLKNGEEVDRANIVFVPKEYKDGSYKTSDGRIYQRQKDGSIRRVKG